MTRNGTLPTSQGVIYTVPTQATNPGVSTGGSIVAVNQFRIVNLSTTVQKTFNLYLNLNGVALPFIPVDTILPPRFCFDDIPDFELPPGAKIEGDASDTGVAWTLNEVPL